MQQRYINQKYPTNRYKKHFTKKHHIFVENKDAPKTVCKKKKKKLAYTPLNPDAQLIATQRARAHQESVYLSMLLLQLASSFKSVFSVLYVKPMHA